MACQIGRVTGITSPKNIRRDGDILRMSGDFALSSPSAGVLLAERMEGYPNSDEPIVPVLYDATDVANRLNAYYEVDSLDVDWQKLAAGLFSWSAVLRKIGHMPLFEVRCLGDDLDNPHALTGQGWFATPGSATQQPILSPLSSSLVGGGTVILEENDFYYDASPTFRVAAANYYQGSPIIVVDGETWVGRHVQSDGNDWSISNGLVRVRPSLTEANHIVVGIRNSGATDYDEVAYRLGFNAAGTKSEYGYNGSTRDAPLGITIRRYTPTTASIRVHLGFTAHTVFGGATTTAPASAYLDITLRRGQTYADMRFGIFGGGALFNALGLGVWRATTDGAASITGGVEDNAAVGGIKWRIYTPISRTADTTNGGLHADTGVDNIPFAIGNDQTIFGGLTFAEQYFAAQRHTQRVVKG